MSNCAYSPLYELARTLLPSRARLKIMGLFGAYFDASGTHKPSTCITVAGVVTPATRWKTFDSKWWHILKRAEVPENKHGYRVFHMTDYNGGYGDFKGWDKTKKDYVMKKIVRAMARRIQFGIAKSVNLSEYDAVKAEFKSFRGISPFTFCFVQCLMELSFMLDEMNIVEPIAYAFERGDGYGNELDILKRAIEKNQLMKEKFRWESFTTLEKYKYPALQAADVVAFEGQKAMLNYIIPGKELIKPRESLKGLKRAFHHYGGYLRGGPVLGSELREIASNWIAPPIEI